MKNIITEKLEDISSSIKKKWYDIFNMKLRKAFVKEIEEVFNKNFKVNHPIIDNKKTKINVSLPLIGYTYWIEITLYDKKGNEIIDYNHPDNHGKEPLVVQIMKKGNRWSIYYHTLFLKLEYQKKNIGSKIISSLNKCMKILQNTKEVYYQGVNIGRYFISRIKGVRFKNSHDQVDKNYKKWCNIEKIDYKRKNKPSEYPKEYLISKIAPEFIDYMVPI
jgi:hypothetical protein